jgi:hypothetical protein
MPLPITAEIDRPRFIAKPAKRLTCSPFVERRLSSRHDHRRSRPQLRFGHIPGNALTVERLQRKLEPPFFLKNQEGL